jgi:hypothetical protein
VVGKSVAKVSLVGAIAVIASFFLADVWMRTPSLWWLFPSALLEVATGLYKPENQEQLADMEFAVCFLALLVLFILVFFLLAP